MRRKKDQHEEAEVHLVHDESNWLVSYADLMTLLFGFFVLMYSMSRVDHEKFEIVRKDLVKYFGGPLKENPGALNLKEKFDEIVRQFNGEKGEQNQMVSFRSTNGQIEMIFSNELLFHSGSAELTETSAKVIDQLSQELKKVLAHEIIVEGHTDIDPIQSYVFPSNWELSAARASRIVRRIIENGIEGKHLTAQGMADSRPLVPHRDERGVIIEENKKKNRRVVLTLRLPDLSDQRKAELQATGFKPSDKTIANVGSGRNLVSGLSGEIIDSSPPVDVKEAESLKRKLVDAQARYQQATQKLKSVQDLEKSLKEMEQLAKKTEEIERKIQSVEKKAEETLNRTLKEEESFPKER